ncbi:MAG: hypothetical protein K8L99_20905 [Anaerolineae bacterium]|nr:hypothetical protein [Anaerolineae bacterium]
MQHYAILCHARTGSNYLVNVLAQHPQITAHNELFHERTIYHAAGEIANADVIARRNADPIAFLEASLKDCQTPVCGFKHLLFYDDQIIDYVLDGDFDLFILERENVLAQYSSMWIAHATGQWTLEPGAVAVASPQIEWHESDFDEYRVEYSTLYADLRARVQQRKAPLMWLRYLDLFRPDTPERIFRFLGVNPDVPLGSMIRKQNTASITQRFLQPDAVAAYLARIGRMEWAEEHLP